MTYVTAMHTPGALLVVGDQLITRQDRDGRLTRFPRPVRKVVAIADNILLGVSGDIRAGLIVQHVADLAARELLQPGETYLEPQPFLHSLWGLLSGGYVKAFAEVFESAAPPCTTVVACHRHAAVGTRLVSSRVYKLTMPVTERGVVGVDEFGAGDSCVIGSGALVPEYVSAADVVAKRLTYLLSDWETPTVDMISVVESVIADELRKARVASVGVGLTVALARAGEPARLIEDSSEPPISTYAEFKAALRGVAQSGGDTGSESAYLT